MVQLFIVHLISFQLPAVYLATHPTSPIGLPLTDDIVYRPFARPEDHQGVHRPLESDEVGPLWVPERPAVPPSFLIDEPQFPLFDSPYRTVATAQRQVEQPPPTQPSSWYYDNEDSEGGENEDDNGLRRSPCFFRFMAPTDSNKRATKGTSQGGITYTGRQQESNIRACTAPSEATRDRCSKRANGEIARVVLYQIALLSFVHENLIDVEFYRIVHNFVDG